MRWFLCFAVVMSALGAAESARPFSQSISAEQKQRLGLAGLTPAQLAELDAAVGAYARGETNVAVRAAVQSVEQKSAEKIQRAEQQAAVAAESAVQEYRRKQEPAVVARSLEIAKRKAEEDKRERFTARIVGAFHGWRGGTYFPLDNGQVWRQSGTESFELPTVVEGAEVEIYKSNAGYWRLKYGGDWITVKRLQ